jgi:hypothetical protein
MFIKCKNKDEKWWGWAIFINEVATQRGSFVPVNRIVVAGNNLQQHSEETKNC